MVRHAGHRQPRLRATDGRAVSALAGFGIELYGWANE